MVAAATSARYIFDLQPGDVYWCTADCGWVTGTSLFCGAHALCIGQCIRKECSALVFMQYSGAWEELQLTVVLLSQTGHTYLAYGPLLCGAQTLIYEGVVRTLHTAVFSCCWQKKPNSNLHLHCSSVIT